MKKILVIGASSAIAQACCQLYAPLAADFYLVSRSLTKLVSQRDDLIARGACTVTIEALDLALIKELPPMIARAAQQLGRFDLVLIAQGVLPVQAQCQNDALWGEACFHLNANSVIVCTELAAQVLSSQHHGQLAVIGSVAGERGRASNYWYGSAKAAVSVFLAGLHIVLAKRGVTVTELRPGFVATPMTADLSLPKALTISSEQAAALICQAIKSKRRIAYIPSYWRLIMWVIRNLPAVIFDKLKI